MILMMILTDTLGSCRRALRLSSKHIRRWPWSSGSPPRDFIFAWRPFILRIRPDSQRTNNRIVLCGSKIQPSTAAKTRNPQLQSTMDISPQPSTRNRPLPGRKSIHCRRARSSSRTYQPPSSDGSRSKGILSRRCVSR
jgi:hypothetical protein